jgi:hypothetical protein
MLTRALRLVTLVALAACATIPAAEPALRVAGHYRYGFEIESFKPCGNSEEWWVARADELRARARDVPTGSEHVYAVIRARVSPDGMYGHLGAYSRLVSVVEVLEVRPATSTDCP